MTAAASHCNDKRVVPCAGLEPWPDGPVLSCNVSNEFVKDFPTLQHKYRWMLVHLQLNPCEISGKGSGVNLHCLFKQYFKFAGDLQTHSPSSVRWPFKELILYIWEYI